jgi:hypothetical protein
VADLSVSYNFGDIATASDAASDAASKAVVAQSKASDASSAAAGVSDAASNALSKATKASSAAAAVSDAASNALSKAGVASAAVSNALSKATVASAAASDALSKAAIVSDAASKAKAQSSDVASKVSARSATWDTKCVIIKVYAEASAIASGDGKAYFTVPECLNGMNLTGVGGHLYTAATSGVVGVMIRNATSAIDMLSAAKILEWDATEKDTATAAAASAVVINTAGDGVLTGEEIAVDIDAAASGAKGMEIRLQFRTP